MYELKREFLVFKMYNSFMRCCDVYRNFGNEQQTVLRFSDHLLTIMHHSVTGTQENHLLISMQFEYYTLSE